MKKIISMLALGAALAVPAFAVAVEPTPTDQKNAAKECKALLASMGTTNFRTEFGKPAGSKNAYGKCVSKKSREEAAERKAAKSNASKDCKAERAADRTAFDGQYRNLGACVSKKAKENKAASDQADNDKISASEYCRGQQTADKAAFDAAYRNFGACVSKRAHEINAERKAAQQQPTS